MLALLALALKPHALILTQKLWPIAASVFEGPSPLEKKKQQHRGCFPTWTQQRFRNAFDPASRAKDQTRIPFPAVRSSVRPLKLLGSFKRPKHSSIKGLATEADAYLVTLTCFRVCGADLSTPGTKDWHQAAPRRAAIMT